MNLCECGCGQPTKKFRGRYNRFIHGHNRPFFGKHHTEESNRKNREAHLGIKDSKETKKLKKKAMIGKNIGENNPMFGKHHTEKTRKEISEALKGENSPMWNPDREQVYAPYTEKFYDKEYRQLIFETNNNGSEICPICKKKEIKELHHIDYNKQNDNIENMIFLCKSCHRKTNHNKDYWQKYFRKHK